MLINCLDKLIDFTLRFPASIRLLVAKIKEVLKLYMDFWLCGELTSLIPALLKVTHKLQAIGTYIKWQVLKTKNKSAHKCLCINYAKS